MLPSFLEKNSYRFFVQYITNVDSKLDYEWCCINNTLYISWSVVCFGNFFTNDLHLATMTEEMGVCIPATKRIGIYRYRGIRRSTVDLTLVVRH